jgi:hypothetical protein
MQIDLGKRFGGEIIFSDEVSLHEWIQQQKSLWRSVRAESQISSEIIKRLNSRLDNFENSVVSLINQPGVPSAEDRVAGIIQTIRPIIAGSDVGEELQEAMIFDRPAEVQKILSGEEDSRATPSSASTAQRIDLAYEERLLSAVREALPEALRRWSPHPEDYIQAMDRARSEMAQVERIAVDLREQQEGERVAIQRERSLQFGHLQRRGTLNGSRFLKLTIKNYN